MARKQCFKAVREDGGSFHNPDFMWATEPGGITTHPDFRKGDNASGYLSVATVATDCTGFRWPCRLLVVESVVGHPVFTPDVVDLPNKRAAGAFRTVGERPAHEVFGSQGELVVALITQARTITPEQADDLYAARDAAGALTLRDLIGTGNWTREAYETLIGPWVSVMGKIHPDD